MKIPKATAKEHADSFDRCYEKSENLSHGLRRPLRDIDQLDWGRGPHANLYYAYMYIDIYVMCHAMAYEVAHCVHNSVIYESSKVPSRSQLLHQFLVALPQE